MKILFVTPEIAPWVKTGGLGDVAGALPQALRAQGLDVRVLVPAYPALQAAFPAAREIARPQGLGGLLPSPVLREARTSDGTPLLLLDHAPYFNRPGSPYLGPDGHDWPDNHLRFGLLSRVAAWLGAEASSLSWRPDVIHGNDWQSGLAPAYLRFLPGARAKSLLTLHNLSFQGLFAQTTLAELGLPADAWRMDGVEYHGHLSFLKAGLQCADAITTVSPTYAQEIQTEAEGMGLAGLLRYRAAALTGILNGIDTAIWNPASDPCLAAPFQPYDARRLAAKAKNKTALQQQLGLTPRSDLPLIGIVSRLTRQKGLDLVAMLGDALFEQPAQLVVLGSGEAALEDAFSALARRHPGLCAVTLAFDETLAHRIEAGADLFLMPSRFEPCGLNQMYSLHYGTPPIVRATGGLADTVIDAADGKHGNGFVFTEATVEALLATLARAIETWRDPKRWRRLQRNGMSASFAWAEPARRYAELYAQL